MKKKAGTLAEDEVSPEVSNRNPMFQKSPGSNSLFSEKKKSREGRTACERGEKMPGSANSGVLFGENSMFAFVRKRKGLLFAFKPLVQSDYKLGYLTFRPMYLVVIFVLACSTAIAPPSSRFAVLRSLLSIAVITMYYSVLAWSRPMRQKRRWVLPVMLSIFFATNIARRLRLVP